MRLDTTLLFAISKLVRYVDCIQQSFAVVLMCRHACGDAELDRMQSVAQSHHLGLFADRRRPVQFTFSRFDADSAGQLDAYPA
ncbi:hypothetical protein CUJ91_23880 [Paraburkholderia graminis]|nr:hypothetical protein CUJ91_23880 [Paraburkholderia graminis]